MLSTQSSHRKDNSSVLTEWKPLESLSEMECQVRFEAEEDSIELRDDMAHVFQPPGKPVSGRRHTETGVCALVLMGLYILIIIATVPFSLYFCIQIIQEFERAVIFRSGRLTKGGTRGPGLFFHIPCTDTYYKVDLRTVAFNAPRQMVLTNDSVTIEVDTVVYYRITNATAAVTNVADCTGSTQLLAVSTLRNILGTKSLSEILSETEEISLLIKGILDEATHLWGVKVERVEIRNMRLPGELQRPMAVAAEASRRAKAKMLSAEGELKASAALREAADIMGGAASAMDLRYQTTLTSIAAENNSVSLPQFIELYRLMNQERNCKDMPLQTPSLITHQGIRIKRIIIGLMMVVLTLFFIFEITNISRGLFIVPLFFSFALIIGLSIR